MTTLSRYTAASPAGPAFLVPPDPAGATSLDEYVEQLRRLKAWAGSPSYGTITDRINTDWRRAGRPGTELARRATVADCFKTGRRRLNTDLVIAVVQALHPDVGYVTQWRHALRVITGEISAAAQVRVQDRLPQDLSGFSGRAAELARLRRALRRGARAGDAVVIAAIGGMAGVGKTQLAIHAGHLMARDTPFERVLFVNLRGFHPDPTQPPAEPTAVLDGFLRLLGVPGHRIPHDLSARSATYRSRLAGTHSLVVLDNAASEDQVRPLLPNTPGCPVLVTSRRTLAGLDPATHLVLEVYPPQEALDFLRRAAPAVPVGPDTVAAQRIARRCGYLPLALGLITGRIRATPGWTLTDHADRLDECHRHGNLESGVELALDLSYRSLTPDQKRLLRLVALHPGPDFDPCAAAALAGTDPPTAQAGLDELYRDHMLQRAAPGRYTLHDLVRAYAGARSCDEDPAPTRRGALTRLFDFYLARAAAVPNTLTPAETYHRPQPDRADASTLDLTDPDIARTWLDTERPTLVAVAAHAAAHGWPGHATGLSVTLYRYLNGGYPADALAVHGHASRAAARVGDVTGQALALNGLGATYLQLSRYGPAVEHLQQALALFGRARDRIGGARALTNLGLVETHLGRYRPAGGHLRRALDLFRRAGDRAGEARALVNLGVLEGRTGSLAAAADRHQQALALFQVVGDRAGEATALYSLGDIEMRMGRYRPAAGHLRRARALYRRLRNRVGEARTVDSLGVLSTRLGRPEKAIELHQTALAIFRETDDPDSEAGAHNGLGEAARVLGRPAEALAHHAAAFATAVDTDAPDERARALTGLGHARRALDDAVGAREHFHRALAQYLELGRSEAEEIRGYLAEVEDRGGRP